MEAKRLATEMKDFNSVAAWDAIRNRHAREVSYPKPHGRSETPEDDEMIVEVSPDPAGTWQNSVELQDNNSESEKEQPQPKKTRRARKTGLQQGRQEQIILRVEGQPESMVYNILDQPIERIMVRRLLGLSRDLLREIWRLRRLPRLNKKTIPSTQEADIDLGATLAKTSANGQENLLRVSVEVCTIGGLKDLYSCTFPTVNVFYGVTAHRRVTAQNEHPTLK